LPQPFTDANGDAPAVSHEEFNIDVQRLAGLARVRPAGELDMATVARLDRRLSELRAAGVRRLVVDLRDLTFMDSTGLSVLLRWARDAAQDGFDFGVVRTGGPVNRLFELAGVEHHLPFVEPEG
jgi:anti-anti-sigma factor